MGQRHRKDTKQTKGVIDVYKGNRQTKIDQDKHYEKLEEGPVSDKAREHFKRPVYGAVDVSEYMAKRCDIKKVVEL